MSRASKLYGRVSPRLAGRPGSGGAARAHAWLIRKTRGRVGTRFFDGAPLLVLRTVGRKSGEPRESPMIYVRDGDAFVVCASNAAAERTPAWWLNLQAQPDAEVFVQGESVEVRARAATDAETERLWPQMSASYAGFDHYRAIATREMPLVVLERR